MLSSFIYCTAHVMCTINTCVELDPNCIEICMLQPFHMLAFGSIVQNFQTHFFIYRQRVNVLLLMCKEQGD